jgi:hypothetical protein
MRKKFIFNKIHDRYKQALATPEVEISLEEKDSRPVFSASCGVWNSLKTHYLYCGQAFDELSKESTGKNPTFKKIYRLWKAHHYQGINASPEQAAKAALELYRATMNEIARSKVIEELSGYVQPEPCPSPVLRSDDPKLDALMVAKNLELPITVLNLPTRLNGAIYRHFKVTNLENIKLKHLTSLSIAYIRRHWMNFGQGSINELQGLLKPYGLYIKLHD